MIFIGKGGREQWTDSTRVSSARELGKSLGTTSSRIGRAGDKHYASPLPSHPHTNPTYIALWHGYVAPGENMKALLATVLLLGVATGIQIVPFPTAPDGFVLGPANANITMDVYYDHLCSGSAAAFPALYEYWQKHQDWLQLVIHIFPLPYHTYAFPVAQAGKFIETNYSSQFMNYVSYMFKHQDTYLETAMNWEWDEIMTQLAQDTETATGVPAQEVLDALNDENVNWNTRVSWKYATTRNVPGTPIYFVNGVWVPDVSPYDDYLDWWKFFLGLGKD